MTAGTTVKINRHEILYVIFRHVAETARGFNARVNIKISA